MFQQIFQRRHIITDFRHFRIMVKVGISCLPVALLGHNYHAQSLRRVTAILVRRDTSLCRDDRATSPRPHPARWRHSRATGSTPAAGRYAPLQTIQLAQQHHRHIQLLSQHLRFPSGLCHLLLTVTVTLPRRHIAKLQIINKNHVTLPPGFSATARLSAHDPYSPPYCHPRVSASAKVLQPPHVPPTSPARWVLLSANVAG